MFTAFDFCCNDKSLGIIYPPPDCVSVPFDPDGACTPLIITLSSCSISLLTVYLVIAPPCSPSSATIGSGVTSKNVGVITWIAPCGCCLYCVVLLQHPPSTFNVNPVAPNPAPDSMFVEFNVIIAEDPAFVPKAEAFNVAWEIVIVSPAA